jgi:uncharacterized protein
MLEPVARSFRPPDGSYFLFGPRGTGKTTLLRVLHPDAVFVDLLDPATSRELSAGPERLAEIVRAAAAGVPIVVDEVQRVPELLTVVHALIESDGRRFILTGSSARKLRHAGEDLLAGRAVLRTLHPFTAAELGERFDLDRALRHGTIPLIWSASDPDDVLRSYAALYVREEVQQEGLVRNVGSFSRFLEAVSFSHASLLNVSAVSRECGVERKTVAAYIEILHDLLLAFSLRVFTKRARRALVGHPKLYLVDPGVFRSLRPSGPLDRPEEIEGAALEGLVISMLRADIAYRNADDELSFWRTRSGVEVDCVVYGPKRFEAIEVKNSNRVRPEDERGLRAFLEDYPEARATVVYRGERPLERSGIRWVPVDTFLRSLGSGPFPA